MSDAILYYTVVVWMEGLESVAVKRNLEKDRLYVSD